jgi:hypothetical protein
MEEAGEQNAAGGLTIAAIVDIENRYHYVKPPPSANRPHNTAYRGPGSGRCPALWNGKIRNGGCQPPVSIRALVKATDRTPAAPR